MGKKLPNTPRSRIRSSLRQLWLRSRERAAAKKREGNCCQVCGRKETRAKGKEFIVEVHHAGGKTIPWEMIIDMIYEHILVHPDKLEALCPGCHDESHKEESNT